MSRIRRARSSIQGGKGGGNAQFPLLAARSRHGATSDLRPLCTEERKLSIRIGATKAWRNSVALPLLLGSHLVRRPHRPSVHLLSRTSLIREPCFLSPCVLGPPLGPLQPLAGLQGIRFCSLEVHQLHLAATFQIITHGTPLPIFSG